MPTFPQFFFSFDYRVETIDGGKVLDSTPFPFPSLGQITRFQTMRVFENNALMKISKTLFSGSKLQFLENLVYPEMANQLQHLVERAKMNTQLQIAEKEMLSRQTKKNNTEMVSINTSFSVMPMHQLKAWISEIKQKVNTPRSSTIVQVGGQGRRLTLPSASSFKFSFVDYDDIDAQLTCQRMDRSKYLARHPINLASFAILGLSLPISIDNNALLAQTPLHSSDNVRYSIALTPIVADALFFLSYGTYQLDARTKDPRITIDHQSQTEDETASL